MEGNEGNRVTRSRKQNNGVKRSEMMKQFNLAQVVARIGLGMLFIYEPTHC